jgi:hypothetical protein
MFGENRFEPLPGTGCGEIFVFGDPSSELQEHTLKRSLHGKKVKLSHYAMMTYGRVNV